jgi:hypothetical protein
MRLEPKVDYWGYKLPADNAGERLLERLAPPYPSPESLHLLRSSLAELSGEIRTAAQGVVVTLDPPDTPSSGEPSVGLGTDLSEVRTTFLAPTCPSLTEEIARLLAL